MTRMVDGTQIVGYTLIHFLWQGAVLTLAAAAGLWLCRHRSAEARYAIASVTLAAMLVTPVVTLGMLLPLGSPGAWIEDGAPPVAALGTAAAVADAPAFGGHLSPPGGWTGVERALPYVVLTWILGVLLLLSRMAGGLWRVHRLHAAALAERASHWQASAERLASRLGLRVLPHVVESVRVSAPAVVGWLRPAILLPAAALTNLTPLQIEAILVHELAHVRRNDYLVNLLQTVAETLLFYHPGVWWVSQRIRLEREQCCDDVAVEVCGDAVDYASALTELEAWRTENTGLATAATGGSLGMRVRRLLRMPPDREPRPANALLIGGLTIALVVGVAHLGVPFTPTPAVAGATARPQHEEPIATPDTFAWRVHATDHFEIHYYPALADDLPLVEVAAEQAYQRVSDRLGQSVRFKVPLVLFKTRRDFEQQKIAPGASMAWVTAFSEPVRNRIVLLVGEGKDLFPRITHELTHIFVFQVVPRDSGRPIPVWMDEGLAEYVAGAWAADELLELRQMVVSGAVPNMSTLSPGDQPSGADGSSPIRRAVLLGHAAFEFVEARYGAQGIRRFPPALQRAVVGKTGDVYRAAFDVTPGEFDAAFRQYLKQRFASGS